VLKMPSNPNLSISHFLHL